MFMKEKNFTKEKMFMKKKLLKNSKIHLRKKLFIEAKVSIFFFKIFPKKSERVTAECQPTPKKYILGNKPTPVSPNTKVSAPFAAFYPHFELNSLHICNLSSLHEFYGCVSLTVVPQKMISHKIHICNLCGRHDLYECVSANLMLEKTIYHKIYICNLCVFRELC